MADESKPQAGFLTGKKVEPAPAAEQTPQPPPPLDDGQKAKLVGFLKRGVMAKPAEPPPQEEPAPVAAPTSSNGAAPAAAKAPTAAAKAQAGTGSGKVQPARGQAPAKPTAAAAAPAKAAPNRPLAEQHLHKGLDHYDRQETDQALVEYQECVKADPTFALGHNNLGMVLIDLERYDEAVESLYESIRCDPQYAEAYNNLGFVLRRTQRHVEAACAYERFLQIEPEVEEGPRIKGWVGTVLKENNLTELPPFTVPEKPAPAGGPSKIKKMAAWEVAVNTETAAPVSALGEILTDPAQDALKTASALPSSKRPDVPGQEAYRAAQAAAAAAPASASQAAAKVGPPKPASKIGPGVKPPGPGGQPTLDSAVAKIEKGLDHFAEGELDQAAALFQQAIAEEPENAEAHTGLGKVLVRQENFNGGIEELQKAIQIAPDDPAAYYVLGFALRAVERNIEASESYEKFLELMPEAVETEKMRQWIMHVKGAASVGIVEDNTVVEEEELTSETDQKYKAALQRFQDGDVDNSLRECVRILNEDAAHYRTRVLLGRIFLRQKQYDNAVEQLEGALVTRPDYPEALYFLGQAAEKRGTTDLAIQSYKRYIEVNPQGPRAERINEWLVMNGAGGDTASQVQCELCLRFFPGSEVSQHEGKATCRNCLTVMGAAPASMEAPVAHAQRAAADAALGTEVQKRGAPKGLIAVGVLAIIAGGIAALFFLGKLDPLLYTLGWKKRPEKSVVVGPIEVNTDLVPKPISSALITGEPQLQVSPYARWTYTPKLTGAESLDSDPAAKGWKKELKLKGGPPGMAVEGDSITWNPVPADWETLKAGETYPVEISIRGSWMGKDNKSTELFAVAKSFVLNMQFGYDLGPEVDLDLKPSDQIALATGDLNGDGIADLVVCSGQFRTGALRVYINRGGGQLAAPASLASGSRFSAAWVGDLDGDRNDDILAVNWQTGKLTPYFRDGGLPVASTAIDLGPGPVALAVGKMDDGRNMYIAALQGVAHSLEITSLAPDRKFGELIRIPMPSGGPHAWIFPWTSAQVGTGFLTIVPLAENPIQLVTFNKGSWNKGGGTIQSGINDVGLVSAAAVLSGGAGKPQRLALIVTKTGNNSYLLIMEERAGTFTPIGTKVPLQTPGLGLVARDFNQDGQDDLFVVTPEESIIYFCDPQSGELKPGPSYKTPKMRGAAVPMNVGNAARPDMLLLDENAKARILRASESK